MTTRGDNQGANLGVLKRFDGPRFERTVVVGESNDEEDGIHPLDRDYTKPVPSPPKQLRFTESRGLNLGILGI